MDIKIRNTFEEILNKDFMGAVISNSNNKELVTKIKIRPVIIKSEFLLQISEFKGEKVFHSNNTKEELLNRLPDWFDGLFKQAELSSRTHQVTILISKKGKTTILSKQFRKSSDDSMGNIEMDLEHFSHNKKKNYILSEGVPLPFLIDLGVMTRDGMIVKAKSDKFRQINRFLEYIEDILPYLDKNRELTILDFGCGKSYLTFVMYYYLKVQRGYQINVIGLDLKTDVIQHCNALSEKYGYDKLHFIHGDIASYNGTGEVDMVVSLHACDTATDHAIYKAISWGARVILSVPCCQHELNRQISNERLSPILKHGIVKERLAALITDAIRAELLETMGYRVQLLEFIDMEHTPKNILIRAVKKNHKEYGSSVKEDKLKECMEFLGVSPCLQRLIQEGKAEDGK